jgi:hypothetical protein
MSSAAMLERFLIVVEHLVILIGHPGVETLLLVCVDVAGSLERCEIRQIVKGFGSSQEDEDLFETPVWTSGCAHSVVEQCLSRLNVIFSIKK